MSIFKRHKTFSEVIEMFLPEKKVQIKHKSYLAYPGKAEILNNWLKDHGLENQPMRKITQQHITDFFVFLVENRKLDRPTVYKYFECLRVVFKYAKRKGEVDIIPFEKEEINFPPKGKDCSSALIPPEKLPDLLDDICTHDPQLYMACMLEYYCGARPGKEVRLLKAGDFNLVEGVLRIDAEHAKSAKTRHITMAEDFVEYCREYGIDKVDPTLYVFGKSRTFGSRVICENNLNTRFNKYREKHGLVKETHLYSFKHVGASFLIRSKVIDIEQLRDHLGHAHITATQHYVKKIIGSTNLEIKKNFPNPRLRNNLQIAS